VYASWRLAAPPHNRPDWNLLSAKGTVPDRAGAEAAGVSCTLLRTRASHHNKSRPEFVVRERARLKIELAPTASATEYRVRLHVSGLAAQHLA